MKFIDENGEIHEGTPITEEEIERRAALTEILHEKICSGRYHGKYDLTLPECKKIALYLLATFDMSPRNKELLDNLVDQAKRENLPMAVEPAPQPESTVGVATDIPW